MAEIGLIASILSVAAFGTSVATTLYKQADTIKGAHQQINALARHVTQFTAVLKHMGEVLETEKANCSKELLHDIRKIQHSCKRTFREIKSATRSKHFRRFTSVIWLFKKTKAAELQARLDSQQSMLQCIIHTLTVSKLGRLDSRSKEESEHLTGLKVEIRLLRALILDSHGNLTELRHAEQTTEKEAQNTSAHRACNHREKVYQHEGDKTSDSISKDNKWNARIHHSPKFASNASESETENNNLYDEADDMNDDDTDNDADSSESMDQHDQDSIKAMGQDEGQDKLISRPALQEPSKGKVLGLDSRTHRESNILLEMIPYKPRLPDRIHSDRLIDGVQITDNDTKPVLDDAINSVRLLLDKWTTSGSAPVSSILDEEATRMKNETEVARDRPSEYLPRRWSSPSTPKVEIIEDEHDPNDHSAYPGNPPQFQRSRKSSPWLQDSRPSHYSYPRRGTLNPQRRDFWSPSDHLSSLDRPLGTDILSTLRSNRGGLYYMKSNHLQQVHYVDQTPIYTCALVPLDMIPSDERKALNTEVCGGLVRKEALDLLGYFYSETKRGTYSISGDLELREIEEIVNLSYQALQRDLSERSKTVIKNKGWGEAVNTMKQASRAYPNDHPAAPSHDSPALRPWHYEDDPYGGYVRGRSRSRYEDRSPDEGAVHRVPRPRPAREYPNTRRRERTFSPVIIEHRRQRISRSPRPEVRFTLPRKQIVSGAAKSAEEIPDLSSTVKPNGSLTKTAEELQAARQRLEQVKQRKETAEEARDHAIASDLTYFVIPELNLKIERLQQQQQQQEQEDDNGDKKHSSPFTFHNEEDKTFHPTEVETDSEASYDGDAEARF